MYVVTKLFYMAGTEMLESNVIKQPDTMKAYDVYWKLGSIPKTKMFWMLLTEAADTMILPVAGSIVIQAGRLE